VVGGDGLNAGTGARGRATVLEGTRHNGIRDGRRRERGDAA
jgi:hypothetical protein